MSCVAVGKHGPESAEIRSKLHLSHCHTGVGKNLNLAVAPYPVKARMHIAVPVCSEEHIAVHLIESLQGNSPVGSVSEAPESLAIVGEEINLLPSAFEITDHVEPVLTEKHILEPVHPSVVLLVVNACQRTVRSTY